MALLALARRGFNLFKHPHYMALWRKWLPLALLPDTSGNIYGGSSGSHTPYATSAIVAKFMFPKCDTIDFVYRHLICEGGKKYSRLSKLQTRAHAACFALPAFDERMEGENIHSPESDLPLTFHCPNRGKVIVRSGWKKDAMSVTLDARPDAVSMAFSQKGDNNKAFDPPRDESLQHLYELQVPGHDRVTTS